MTDAAGWLGDDLPRGEVRMTDRWRIQCKAAADKVVSAEELLERVWDEAADPFTTAVKTTMRRLRAKLGDPQIIETVREGGYRIGGL